MYFTGLKNSLYVENTIEHYGESRAGRGHGAQTRFEPSIVLPFLFFSFLFMFKHLFNIVRNIPFLEELGPGGRSRICTFEQ